MTTCQLCSAESREDPGHKSNRNPLRHLGLSRDIFAFKCVGYQYGMMMFTCRTFEYFLKQLFRPWLFFFPTFSPVSFA
jgi:hypothetical protein